MTNGASINPSQRIRVSLLVI